MKIGTVARAIGLLAIATIVIALPLQVSAAVPQLINYQANLTSGGVPVTNNVSILFAIYDDPTMGTLLWSETQSVQPDLEGNFAVLLGSVNPVPDSAFAGGAYLSMTVGADPEMLPRQQLVSVPNSFVTQSVDGDFVSSPGSITLVDGGTGAKGSESTPILRIMTAIDDQMQDQLGNLRTIRAIDDQMQDQFGNTRTMSAIDDQMQDQLGNTRTMSAIDDQMQDQLGNTRTMSAIDDQMQDQAGNLRTIRAIDDQMQDQAGNLRTIRAIDDQMQDQAGNLRTIRAIDDQMQDQAGNFRTIRAIDDQMQDQFGNTRTIRAMDDQMQDQSGNSHTISAIDDQMQDQVGNSHTITAIDDQMQDQFGNYSQQSSVSMGIFDQASSTTWDQDGVSFLPNGVAIMKGAPAMSGPAVFYGRNGIAFLDGDSLPVLDIDPTGIIEASGLRLPGGAVNGYVLTADASGNATWQAGGGGGGGGNGWADDGTSVRLETITDQVGIGTASPTEKLDVVGNVKATSLIATSDLTVGGKATIGKFLTNNGSFSLVVGDSNEAYGGWSTIGGGYGNASGSNYNVLGGGAFNFLNANYGTLSGGYLNQLSGQYAVISGGGSNAATGLYSMVPGGNLNSANGTYSFAAGRRATATHNGSFVWGDSYNGSVSSSAADQFTARASGGVRFFSNTALSTGVTLAAGGGSWASVSDRNVKQNIRPVDGNDILERLSQLDIARWNYESQDPSIEHIGPMAQDFYALFGVGDNNTTITTVDPDGIALAAIKALHETTQALQTRTDQLNDKTRELDELRNQVAQLQRIVDELVKER